MVDGDDLIINVVEVEYGMMWVEGEGCGVGVGLGLHGTMLATLQRQIAGPGAAAPRLVQEPDRARVPRRGAVRPRALRAPHSVGQCACPSWQARGRGGVGGALGLSLIPISEPPRLRRC